LPHGDPGHPARQLPGGLGVCSARPAHEEHPMTPGLLSSVKVRVGAAILLAFLAIAVFGPLLLDALGLDPYDVDRSAIRQPPSAEHWLGTDSSGSDLFAQWVLGARGSVFVG